jgi:hypothetical protein
MTSNEKSQISMDQLINEYVQNVVSRHNTNIEFEVRFGTKYNKISRTNYDNICKYLLGLNYNTVNELGIALLRVNNEYIDKITGEKRMSNIRTEVDGISNIHRYCKSNLVKSDEQGVNFVKKTKFIKDKKPIPYLNKPEYNLRVSMNQEETINESSPIIKQIIDNWSVSPKIFRYLNRVQFYEENSVVFIDCSIVKSSSFRNGKLVPSHSIHEANVFKNPENYEIELELDNKKAIELASTMSLEEIKVKIKSDLMKAIKHVLSGLQNSFYPVSYFELENIGKEYISLTKTEVRKTLRPSNFIGPSSMTLQMRNLIQLDMPGGPPCILDNYTVTEKADGIRKILFISNSGKIYFIGSDMSISFTGLICENKKLFHTMMDGEFITENKRGIPIQLYGAFDIYFIGSKDVRSFPFYKKQISEGKEVDSYTGRLILLNSVIGELKMKSIIDNNEPPVRVVAKKFYVGNEEKTIFSANEKILNAVDSGAFEYETDGLIFTPCEEGVGISSTNTTIKNSKITWPLSFKWKPSEFNTIDFLVSTKKNENGLDIIGTLFQNGSSLSSDNQLIQYKTVILKVGFDSKKDGYINPCEDVLNDIIPKSDSVEGGNTYKPMPFIATNPSDPNSYIMNIALKKGNTDALTMFTESGEAFYDNTIIECKYVKENKEGWRWVPIRVRSDKTAELRMGLKNFGNNYNTANSNWESIHNPITLDMIKTGEFEKDDSISTSYYRSNKNRNSDGIALRDFHNKYAKDKLISSVSNIGDILIDFGVGKAGDLPKWIKSQLNFVFGIDISKDNIENHLDGACARFLNKRKEYKKMPYALFVQGDCGYNIKTTEAIYSQKDKQTTRAIFGIGEKNERVLGKGVIRQFGVGAKGFNISSSQFALHYLFSDKVKLYNFIRNIAECTQVGGYFIGSCYNGNKLFEMLKSKEVNQSLYFGSSEDPLCIITKLYDQKEFPASSLSLGYTIEVYQDTIGQNIKEYLVNIDYFKLVMKEFGLILLDDSESQILGLSQGSNSFKYLFELMSTENPNKNKSWKYGKALEMNEYEKKLSFLNQYFIFQKKFDVNTEEVFSLAIRSLPNQELLDDENNEETIKGISSVQESNKVAARKTSRFVTIKNLEN